MYTLKVLVLNVDLNSSKTFDNIIVMYDLTRKLKINLNIHMFLK